MENKTSKKKITLEIIADSITKLGKRIDQSIIKLNKKIDYSSTKLDEKIDQLAVATARGFEEVNERINNTERTLSGKIEGIDKRIDDLALNMANKDEVYHLTQRMDKVERKINIK